MEIIYHSKALAYWKKSGQKQIQRRILILIQSIADTPFEGIGKPEALKYHWSGMWSRRITQEHRLIYSIESEKIHIHSLRDHY